MQKQIPHTHTHTCVKKFWHCAKIYSNCSQKDFVGCPKTKCVKYWQTKWANVVHCLPSFFWPYKSINVGLTLWPAERRNWSRSWPGQHNMAANAIVCTLRGHVSSVNNWFFRSLQHRQTSCLWLPNDYTEIIVGRRPKAGPFPSGKLLRRMLET